MLIDLGKGQKKGIVWPAYVVIVKDWNALE